MAICFLARRAAKVSSKEAREDVAAVVTSVDNRGRGRECQLSQRSVVSRRGLWPLPVGIRPKMRYVRAQIYSDLDCLEWGDSSALYKS